MKIHWIATALLSAMMAAGFSLCRADDANSPAPPGNSTTQDLDADQVSEQLLVVIPGTSRINYGSLADAITYIRDVTGANFVVDWRAAATVGVDPATKVSVQLTGATVATVLDAILRSASAGKLQYDVGGQAILISTPDGLKQMLAERARPTVFIDDSNSAANRNAARQLNRQLPEVHLGGVALGETIGFLRDIVGVNIVLDSQAMHAAGVDDKTPVALRVHDIRLSNLLWSVLDVLPAHLDYCVFDGCIIITTPDRLKNLPAALTNTSGAPSEKLRASLKSHLPELHFESVGLSDCIDFLRDVTNARIEVNWPALQAAGVQRDTPVSIRVRDVRFSSALDLLLMETSVDKIGWTAEGSVIKISTPKDLAAATTAPSAAPTGKQ
jgi:hypothetical protein